MVGQRFMWAVVIYAAGFISSYLVHRAEQYEMEQRGGGPVLSDHDDDDDDTNDEDE